MKKLLIYLTLLSVSFYGCDELKEMVQENLVSDSEVVTQVKQVAGSYNIELDDSVYPLLAVDATLTVAASGNDVLIHAVEKIEAKEGEKAQTPQALCTLFSDATLDEDLKVSSKNVQFFGAINDLTKIDVLELKIPVESAIAAQTVASASIDYEIGIDYYTNSTRLTSENRLDSSRSFGSLKSECLSLVNEEKAGEKAGEKAEA